MVTGASGQWKQWKPDEKWKANKWKQIQVQEGKEYINNKEQTLWEIMAQVEKQTL